jgi:hypothetical protein
MSKHPIDKIFEDKLKNFEQMPRAAVWDKLNAELDKKAPLSWWKRKVVWWSSGVSITLLSLGLALWQPQATPPPAQVAAKMLDLQLKLAGNPLASFKINKTVQKTSSTNKNNTVTNKTFTQKNTSKQPKQVLPTVGNAYKQPVMGNQPNKTTLAKTPIAKTVAAPRSYFGDYFYSLETKNMLLTVATPEPVSYLPKPPVQPQITVTLKLSENMAGEREQDEGDKGLKKIWKKLKGLDTDKTKNTKKKKRTGILRFLGDRDD